MKISPIPAQGINQGNISTTQSSAEKVAAAKAAFLGEQAPVRIVQSPTTGDPQVDRINSVRSIKMTTNQTPLANETELDGPILDSSEQVEKVTEDTKPLSPQFAALARQRRALQVKERELADRERVLSETSPKIGQDELVARLKSQPLSVLQEYGVTYDQLTEAILANNGSNPDIQALKAEIKALKEGVDKTFTDRDTHQEQQVLAEMRREASILSRTGDTFEMVRETGSLNDVMTLIERTYREQGEVLDVTEALQLVENDLVNEAIKIANYKKVQGKLNTSSQPAPALQQPRTMRTLTSRDGTSIPLSRKERAMRAFTGTLKK
jgi:hypothetical protein